ncbi:outer membrane protein assembly factor BamA [Profundibacter amoris]|uniref:Outer membrane protein assembly factor BamA n=2 Tax=Profundibacter amoris TaxID=2171755 RepID=A0A347UGP6_9RHOB|nr:outer membrane protein assembly factor BamA [Profundibacter amoris]
MTDIKAGRAVTYNAVKAVICRVSLILFLALSMTYVALPNAAQAQSYRFNQVKIEGNQRIEPATILTYAGIARGETVSAAQLNDAYQRILNSGLFESVSVEPRGGTLVIKVKEFPTINRISFEGNKRLKDADLAQIVRSQSRHVYSPSTAEADAAVLTEAYSQQGRYSATVTPKIIRRSENRVDLVFEIVEGKVVEIERLSFVGNRIFSDRRLRRVLETKQAGVFRSIIQKDTFIPDRVEFDKQVLRDFYLSRGYIDFRVLSVNSEIARERNGFFLTFNVREGQRFKFGEISAVSDLPEVDAEEFMRAVKIKSGKTYTPVAVETTISRMERLAIQKGMNFIRVEPRVTRNDRDLTLDIEFVISRGPRVFVERIDIEGNATTLDRVIRRQFKVVEGDPFNPRQIREAAERIRNLGFFSKADVNAREGTGPDQVIVDVNVAEQPTGSLDLGASYGTDGGLGFSIGFQESNFLGRGQSFNFSLNTASETNSVRFSFVEPALLGRKVRLRFSGNYATTEGFNSTFDTRKASFGIGLEFPISENGRLELRYQLGSDKIFNLATPVAPLVISPILQAEEAEGTVITSQLGYGFSYDTRRTGLNPNAGIVLRFGQDFAGLGGDSQFIKTTALAGAETKVYNEEVTLRAVFEGGAIASLSGTNSRVNNRFFLNGAKMRGFESLGIGPRNGNDVNGNALGGNMFAVMRFDAEFPLGLPEEYGIKGGLFLDVGSVWGLDNTYGSGVDDTLHWRSSIGFSILWTTGIGPLRFNFSKALQKEDYDRDRSFELTIQTQF